LKNNFSDLVGKAMLQSKLEHQLLSPQPQVTLKMDNNNNPEHSVKAKVEVKTAPGHAFGPVSPASESLSNFLEDEVSPISTPETVTHDAPLKI